MITSPPGTVTRDGDGYQLEFVRTFATSLEDTWSAVTEPDRCERWFGRWSGDPATGEVQFVWTAEDDSTAQTMRIVECDEPRRLVVEMPGPGGVWRVALDLSPDGDARTRLVFSQRLAGPYDSSIGPGWHFYLDRLGALVAGTTVPSDFDPYLHDLTSVYAEPT